ncbi:YjbF family lipoprotein [Gammaproteobacteria bacterium]|nr:YjbF family lipoprotein [Gammaproteobacteria bacterium]
MNKISSLITILLISNCSYIDYTLVPSAAKTVIFGVDEIVIDEDFYDSQTSSFVKVKIGKRAEAVFVLAKIEVDQFYWISSSGERLITLRNGKVKKLQSDKYSFTLIAESNFPKNLLELRELSYFIELDNPFALFSQQSTFHQSKKIQFSRFNKIFDVNSITEVVSSNSMKWSYSNLYIINDELLPIQSRVHFSPIQDPLELEFYYKY